VDVIYKYEVIGAVVFGGGGPEIVEMPLPLAAGDTFWANHRWFRVKRCGIQECGNPAPYRAEVEGVSQ
jgi:hypothetical protein